MTDTPNIVPVLMSGGAGTRLWPASRSDRPKQFLPLVDDRTMVRATLDRLVGLDAAAPLVVANAAHAHLVRAELSSTGADPSRMVLEPFGRNTAPAAAVAALELTRNGDDPLMLLLPADHVIEDVPAFHEGVRRAGRLAADGYLVTFGIVPSHPETGYGYIKAGQPVGEAASHVDRFVEKPDLPTAEAYLAEGGYLWNSGMFVFRCSDYLEALAEFAPEIASNCRATMDRSGGDQGTYLDAESFGRTPSDSIDYAVMERTHRAVVVPLDAGWSDVGSWTALWEVAQRDDAGNAVVGDVTLTDTTNSYVRADGRLVTVAGLDNVVIVDTDDALLVTTLDAAQSVRKIVDMLKKAERPEATESTREE